MNTIDNYLRASEKEEVTWDSNRKEVRVKEQAGLREDSQFEVIPRTSKNTEPLPTRN